MNKEDCESHQIKIMVKKFTKNISTWSNSQNSLFFKVSRFRRFVKLKTKKLACTKVGFHFVIPLANSVWCLGGHTEEVVEKNPRAYLFLNVIIIFLAELVASGVVIIV